MVWQEVFPCSFCLAGWSFQTCWHNRPLWTALHEYWLILRISRLALEASWMGGCPIAWWWWKQGLYHQKAHCQAVDILCIIIRSCGTALQQHSWTPNDLLALRCEGLTYPYQTAVTQQRWTLPGVVRHSEHQSLCREKFLSWDAATVVNARSEFKQAWNYVDVVVN